MLIIVGLDAGDLRWLSCPLVVAQTDLLSYHLPWPLKANQYRSNRCCCLFLCAAKTASEDELGTDSDWLYNHNQRMNVQIGVLAVENGYRTSWGSPPE